MADDIIVQAQSTLFARNAYTDQRKGYFLESGIVGSLRYAYQNSGVTAANFSAEQLALLGLLGQDSEIIPGGITLYNNQALSPDGFTGAGDLYNIYIKDPFSTAYEDSTNDLFDRVMLSARALAQSGPENVRGGTARQAFELAEVDTLISITRFKEIWQNQLALAAVVVQAVQVAGTIELGRRDVQLKAQQLQAGTEQGRVMQTLAAAEQLDRDRSTHVRNLAGASEFLGVPQMTTSETMEGQGTQGPVATGFGMSYWR